MDFIKSIKQPHVKKRAIALRVRRFEAAAVDRRRTHACARAQQSRKSTLPLPKH
jgi:hypothetical protein